MKVTFEDAAKIVEALPEHTILQTAERAGVQIIATCGRKGRCKSCRIRVLSGELTPPTAEERHALGEDGLAQGFRLACQAHAVSDAVIRRAPPVDERAHHILSSAVNFHQQQIAPNVRKYHLILPPLTEEIQSSDLEEIQRALADVPLPERAHATIQEIDWQVLQELPAVITSAQRDVTVVLRNHTLIAIEPGDTTAQMYGVAFDVGTTTVVGYLLDLRHGAELAVAATLNGQALYGGDVMARLTFALHEPTGQHKLQAKINATLNTLLDDLCAAGRIDRRQIYEIVLVGNTCMHHLALGIAPTHLGVAPYLAAMRRRFELSAAILGLHLPAATPAVWLPLIAGFVGADTVGVILATRMHTRAEVTLAIDIGTNGEIVLGSQARLIACSTAAGTAFEGAHITHGMRGAIGAIDRVVITDDIDCHVIGDAPAEGICGSGLVDAVAQLLDAGLLDPSGRLRSVAEAERAIGKPLPPALRERVGQAGRKKYIVLLHGDATANGDPILLTQHDIRELQLAKGALAAGIAMLLKTLGCEAHAITQIFLAGAFGNYIDTQSALRIGLIPPVPRARIQSVGNAAGFGAQIALLAEAAKREADAIAQQTEHLALTSSPEFQTIFAAQMAFPTACGEI